MNSSTCSYIFCAKHTLHIENADFIFWIYRVIGASSSTPTIRTKANRASRCRLIDDRPDTQSIAHAGIGVSITGDPVAIQLVQPH